jgi:hypothetical protein
MTPPVSAERIAKALAAIPPLDGVDGTGPHLPSTPDTVAWGWMPSVADGPVLEVAPGDVVTIDTVSHEGILGDQGATRSASSAASGSPPTPCSPTPPRSPPAACPTTPWPTAPTS